MLKLLVPLFAKNSCYENANKTAVYCIKNTLASTTKSLENLTLRRHFLFSTTNRKTLQAFPTKPQHQLGVSNRNLGQLELLPANKIIKQFSRNFNCSSVVHVESLNLSEAVSQTAPQERLKFKEADNFSHNQSFEEDFEEEDDFDIKFYVFFSKG